MNKKDLIKTFEAPGAEYRGKPFWSWNGELEEKELKRQVDVMKEMGLGGYFMHSRAGLITEYLGEQWFDLINSTADYGQSVGMESWLYDEDRWPSGSAGGKVTVDPQYRMKSLYIFESSPDKYEYKDDEICVFEAELDGLKLGEYKQIKPEEVKNVSSDKKILQFRIIPDKPNSNFNGTTYIDTMSEKAVDKFIELTHEEYKKRCGDRLGKSIKGIFTDEPHRGHAMDNRAERDGVISCATAYTDDLFDEFKARYGYDLFPVLPELFYQKNGEPVNRVKLNYFDLACNLFVERFMKKINDWCNDNNMIFTGHVLHEDCLTNQTVPNGSLMRSYEHMGYPGIDLLTEHNRCYWVVKQLSSAARQVGKKWLLSELYGCTGWQFNLRSHKAVGDWQALFGINLRCQHLSWYTMEGESKRDYPASILHQSPWYKDYSFVETYFARFGLMMQQGKPLCDVLVINPIESIWCRTYLGWAQWINPVSPLAHETEAAYQKLFNILIRNHIDFDYGEEQMMIPRTTVEKTDSGAILHVGEASYKTVIVSGMITIRPTTLKILKEFKDAGGKIVFAGDTPKYVDAVLSDEPEKLAAECVRIPLEEEPVVDSVQMTCKPGGAHGIHSIFVEDGEGKNCGDVFVQARYDAEADIYIAAILNTNREKATGALNFTMDIQDDYQSMKDCYEPQLWSLETGKRYSIPYEKTYRGVRFELELEAAGSAMVVFSKDGEKLETPNVPETIKEYNIDGKFEYKCDEPQVCVLDFARFRADNGEYSEEDEALKIDRKVRDHFGIEHRGGGMLQPWYSKLNDKKVYGDIELEYTFDIEKMPEGDVFLCGERPEFNAYSINGVTLTCPDENDFYIDNCLKKMPVPKTALKIGENKVNIKVAFMRTTNIEALYLIGDFGVKLDGHKRTLTSLPGKIGFSDMYDYSMPFYTGCVTYTVPNGKFDMPKDGERVILKADKYEGGTVRVGGKVLAWEPYEADITDEVKAGRDIDVTLVGTRRNTFGPLHLVPLFHGAYGPDHFVTGGGSWTDDYNLIPEHLGALTVKTVK